jgi:hypothetical protein
MFQKINNISFDAPPHSLKNSNASLKVNTSKEEGIIIHSLVHNTSGVEGFAKVPGWGLRQMTSESIIHKNLYKPNNKLISV